ncbi:MAG: serine/threonine-protein kinase M1 [Piccolia ochrophora]|nr:MAG: serine/threonine-protein kinase M1 [Piccolia ochrophora]
MPSMARGPGPVMQHNGAANASNDPRDIPPSTIAAQIVNNFTVNGKPTTDDGGSFEQLLMEILGSEEGPLSESSFGDGDIDLNYDLVVVVTRAGLEVLLGEDPFTRVDRLLPQARNSLLVIKSALKRTPAILFERGSSQRKVSVAVPLYIWLFPKLIALLSCRDAEDLQQTVKETLFSIFYSVSRTPDLWESMGSLVLYVEESVKGRVSQEMTGSSVRLRLNSDDFFTGRSLYGAWRLCLIIRSVDTAP